MTIGRMKLRVTLKRRGTTKDTVGQVVETWTTLGTSWASINPIRGREIIQQSGEQGYITHRVEMRARDDFRPLPSDRVEYGSRVFNVEVVLDEMESGKLWSLMCSEPMHTTA